MNTEMNKWQWFIGVLMMGLILTVSLTNIALAAPLSGIFGEHEEDDEEDEMGKASFSGNALLA